MERETGPAKLERLKAKWFSPKGREERVARALEILSMPGPSFNLDKETWVWIAEGSPAPPPAAAPPRS